MSSYRPGSRRTYGPQQPSEPPKKKHTGLIIGIIVAIIVVIIIIIVIILLAGGSSKPAAKTGCNLTPCGSGTHCNTTNGLCVACLSPTDCTSGEKCNTSGACVACLSPTDCTGGQKCSSAGTCVTCNNDNDCTTGQTCSTAGICTAGACTGPTDCTNAAFPVCHSGQCVECAGNTDCSGNTVYSTADENICQTTTNMCVGCVINSDCGVGNTCNSGVCCILTPPIMSGVTGTLSADSTIIGSYSYAGPSTGAQQVMQLLANTTVLSTSTAETSDQVHTFDETTTGIILFPGVSYNIQTKLIFACGTTAYSTPKSGTMPDNGAIEGTLGFTSATVAGPIVLTFSNDAYTNTFGVVMYPVEGTHPNLAVVQVNNITASNVGYSTNISFNWPSGVVRSVGQQWFARVFMMQNPSGTVSTSAPSDLTSEAVITLAS